MVEQKVTIHGTWTEIKAVMRAIDAVAEVLKVQVVYHV